MYKIFEVCHLIYTTLIKKQPSLRKLEDGRWKDFIRLSCRQTRLANTSKFMRFNLPPSVSNCWFISLTSNTNLSAFKRWNDTIDLWTYLPPKAPLQIKRVPKRGFHQLKRPPNENHKIENQHSSNQQTSTDWSGRAVETEKVSIREH